MTVRHHPHLMSAGGHGSWCSCPCGWSSGTYGTTVGAHLAFGRHLVSAEHITRAPQSPPASEHGAADTPGHPDGTESAQDDSRRSGENR